MAALRSYQPQEWVNQSLPSSSQVTYVNPVNQRRHSIQVAHVQRGETSMPSPPPPYSPPNSSVRQLRASMGCLGTDALFVYSQTQRPSSQEHVSRPVIEGQALPMSPALPGPPASRRSHSAGEIVSRTSVHPPPAPTMSTPPSIQGPWQIGLPLPPPPPRPMQHRFAGLLNPTALSPVPPTPAEFIASEDRPSTMTRLQSPPTSPTEASCAVRQSRLARRPAQKEINSEAIKDRRSRSRALRNSIILQQDILEIDSNTRQGTIRPDLLILDAGHGSNVAQSSSLRQRRLHLSTASFGETPSLRPQARAIGEPTPPYSPSTDAAHGGNNTVATVMSPMDTLSMPSSGLASSRPTPTTVCSAKSTQIMSFDDESLERLLRFHAKETTCNNDQQRLMTFAEFIVEESIRRRVEYPSAFMAIVSELYDVTKKIWSIPGSVESVEPSESAEAANHTGLLALSTQPSSAVSSFASSGSLNRSFDASSGSLADSELPMTPVSDQGRFNDLERDQSLANQSPWNDRFKPTLSPIPSMTISSHAGDLDSRGRTASRWWDPSDTSSPGGGSARLERTRQEIKYMSLHPSVIQSPQSPEAMQSNNSNEHDKSEYPPEKVGWHEDSVSDMPSTGGDGQTPIANSTPFDISRLITLPPPFPRHYPAVNNCHPQLEPPRTRYRNISDLVDIEKMRADFQSRESELQQHLSDTREDRTDLFRTGVQGDLDQGLITIEIAREAAKRFKAHEAQIRDEAAYESYARFVQDLFDPVNEALDQKINEAEICGNMMSLALSSTSSSEHSSTTSVQVGGDEEPELLEQLTLSKWLFDLSDLLHTQQLDNVLSQKQKWQKLQRIDRRYRLMSKLERDEMDTIFDDEVARLRLDATAQSLNRCEDLQALIERHVSRGVEAQLSAFWDITPQILELVQRVIPLPPPPRTHQLSTKAANDDAHLSALDVLVPQSEVEDNPALAQFPGQYLFTALTHARNSIRQFVDAQINLLCLLHEVQTATLGARWRLRVAVGDDSAEATREREMGEKRLTAELKGKVVEIERGWDDALGLAIEEARRAVKGFLERCGGWDDDLEG